MSVKIWDKTNGEALPLVTAKESDDIYSTTETKTNKVWIDGKPIYRKVLNIGNKSIAVGENTFAHSIGDFGELVNVDYRFYYESNTRWYSLWESMLSTMCSTTNVILYAKETISVKNLIFTIEYTKAD